MRNSISTTPYRKYLTNKHSKDFWQGRTFHDKHYDTIFIKIYLLFGKAIAKKPRGPDFIEHGVQMIYIARKQKLESLTYVHICR